MNNKNGRIFTKDKSRHIINISGKSFLLEWFDSKYTLEQLQEYLDTYPEMKEFYQLLFGPNLTDYVETDKLSADYLKILQGYNNIVRQIADLKQSEVKTTHNIEENIPLNIPHNLTLELLLTKYEKEILQEFLFNYEPNIFNILNNIYGNDWQNISNDISNKDQRKLRKIIEFILNLLKEINFKEEEFKNICDFAIPKSILLKMLAHDYKYEYKDKTILEILNCNLEELNLILKVLERINPIGYNNIKIIFGSNFLNKYSYDIDQNIRNLFINVYLKIMRHILIIIRYANIPNIDINILKVNYTIYKYNELNRKKNSTIARKNRNKPSMENKTLKEILNCSLEELIKIKEECHNYFYNYQNICNLFGPSWDKDLIYFEENREECLIFHKYNLPFLNELLEQIRSISKERILK